MNPDVLWTCRVLLFPEASDLPPCAQSWPVPPLSAQSMLSAWAQTPSVLSQTDPERPAGPLWHPLHTQQGLVVLQVGGRVDRWRVGTWMGGWMLREEMLLSESV